MIFHDQCRSSDDQRGFRETGRFYRNCCCRRRYDKQKEFRLYALGLFCICFAVYFGNEDMLLCRQRLLSTGASPFPKRKFLERSAWVNVMVLLSPAGQRLLLRIGESLENDSLPSLSQRPLIAYMTQDSSHKEEQTARKLCGPPCIVSFLMFGSSKYICTFYTKFSLHLPVYLPVQLGGSRFEKKSLEKILGTIWKAGNRD